LQGNIQPFQSFLSSLSGVEGTPFAPARLTARGTPAEEGTDADKIISML